MANNIRRLKDEADIGKVINYLGIPVTKRGNSYLIYCPQPDHDDTHATNCYFKDGWNHVYCMACGKTTYAVDLIVYTLGYEYGEACDLLWELSGRPDWYYEGWESSKDTVHFSITREEASFIGIHLPERINNPFQIGSTKTRDEKFKEMIHIKPDFYTQEMNGKMCLENSYIFCKTEYCHWSDFASEEEMARIVMNKASGKKKCFMEMAESTSWQELKEACYEMSRRCENIMENAALFAG